jgi:hypothetical protein
MRINKFFFLCFLLQASQIFGWGFAAHKQINRYAVFTLPPAMFRFYKYYLAYITENAIKPDQRRYVLEGEAAKHYIDLDYYRHKDTNFISTVTYWDQALECCPHDILLVHGTLPWHIEKIKKELTRAFRQKKLVEILKLSTDLGHYLADANVPLHTTENYDGQLSGQEGIHGLWETCIPALFSEAYDFFLGQANYISNSQQRAWESVWQAHHAVDSVLSVERKLAESFASLQQYSFEQKGTVLKKGYSKAYVEAYHALLDGQVERQMRASIQLVGDFWLTCWIDAGKPNLDDLIAYHLDASQLEENFNQGKKLIVRGCQD